MVIENTGEGVDTVQSSVSIALGANVENLTLTGTTAINGTGNALSNTLVGNAAANVLKGGAGNDTLNGGLGTDTLIGGTGNDTYLMSRGYGNELITDTDASVGNSDILKFGSDVAYNQLWFRHVGNNLEVSIIGTSDKATISNWYGGSGNHVEKIVAGDGKVLSDAKVEALVQAMAGFAPPAAGQTSLPANVQTALAPTLAANWQ